MPTTTTIHKRSPKWYGWLPDLPDHHDLLYSAIAPKVARLPKKIDLQAKCSPVEDQGQLDSCTANSLVGALEFLEKKARTNHLKKERNKP
jgi:hypothetical protein